MTIFHTQYQLSLYSSYLILHHFYCFEPSIKFEPYDRRYWAAFYLFLRIAILSTFAIEQSAHFVVVAGILIVLATMTTAIVKPYRKTFYNIIDVAFLSIFVQVLFSAASFPFGAFNKTCRFLTIMFAIGFIVPAVYITILAIYKILPKTWITLIMKHTINIRLFRICCHRSHLLQRRDVGDHHAYIP